MSLSVQPLSGFPEYLPFEQIFLQGWIDTIRYNFELYGYSPIETPAIERLSTLISKGAAEHEIYTLGRYRSNASDHSEDLGLRFDLTVPLARYVAMYASDLVFPFKRYHIGPVWRGERAQKGRFRQFIQCDVDIIANENLNPLYDIDVLDLLDHTLAELKLGPIKIEINHKQLLQGVLLFFGVSSDSVEGCMHLLDKRLKIRSDLFLQELSTYTAQAYDLVSFIDLYHGSFNDVADKILQTPLADIFSHAWGDSLKPLCLLAQRSNAKIVLNLGLARGLAYYTGIVLETFLEEAPHLGSISSGGRYDKLSEHFSSKKRPGVGLSIGISRIFDYFLESLKKQSSFLPHQKASVLVSTQDKESMKDYHDCAHFLRKNGIFCDLYLEDKALSQQIRYADRKGFRYVILANKAEIMDDQWTLKDLHLHTQSRYNRLELVSILKR